MSFSGSLFLEKISYKNALPMYVVAKPFTWKINETSHVTVPKINEMRIDKFVEDVT